MRGFSSLIPMKPTPKTLLILGIHGKPQDESAIEFPAPQGFQTPDNAQEGATFESLATLKMASDGILQLVAIDGMPVSHDAKAEAQEDADETPEDQSAEESGAPQPDADQPEDPQNGDFLQAIKKGLAKK